MGGNDVLRRGEIWSDLGFNLVTMALCEGILEGQRDVKGRSRAQECPRQPNFELVQV